MTNETQSNQETIEEKIEDMQHEVGPLLEVKDLQVDFTTDEGKPIHAVRNSSFSVYPGQWVAIVGESGSGKSTSAMACLGLLPGTGHVVGGSIKLEGQEISQYSPKQFASIRGSKMGLVPQDPMSNLNPVYRIGTQVKEALTANHMDVAHEKRSNLSKALAQADITIKSEGDETFLGSKELPELLEAAGQALVKAGVEGGKYEKRMAYFREEWVPGSETRWRVADDLIKSGVKDDDAWYIAKKYVTGSTMTDRIAGLLDEAGLPDAATRARQYPHEFSGGMRQRALIAIGLACRPELLIADEPTSALDVTVQKRILDHLQELTNSLGTAVLFITHDLGLAAERAQHIVVMYKGQVVESGPSLEVLQNPQHPYTKRLVAAAPSLASQRIISVEEKGEDATSLMDHKVDEDKLEHSDVIIDVDHLTKEFKLPRRREMFKAVDDVSFKIRRGTTLAIVGESGSGKSTTGRAIAGLQKVSGGSLNVLGIEMNGVKERDFKPKRADIGFVFQDPGSSFNPLMTIAENVAEPLLVHHKYGSVADAKNYVGDLLEMVQLPRAYMNRFPHELSGGQRQRASLARGLALKPSLLIADEPTSALDVSVQAKVLELFKRLQAEIGFACLFITHDLAVVDMLADRIMVMHKGQIVEHGDADQIMQHPENPYTKKLLASLPVPDPREQQQHRAHLHELLAQEA